MRNIIAASLIASTLLVSWAHADDWNVTRLRGIVLHQVNGEWLQLERLDVVPDDRRIRTTNNGHVTLVRGAETLELGPSTQIRIFDQGGNKPYTTVYQSWGTVAVEAEVRNVEHFAVTNKYLASVVKGTRFVVNSRSTGGSVNVERGSVAVGSPEGWATVVSAAQTADVRGDGSIKVSGEGTLPAVVAVAAADRAGKGDDKKAGKEAADAARAAEKAAREAAKAAEKAARDAAKNKPRENENSGKGKGDDTDKGKSPESSGKGKSGGPDNGKGRNGGSSGKVATAKTDKPLPAFLSMQ